MRGRVHRPSPSMVIALTALVIALGGTSYAAFSLPKNSVGTKQLKNKAVTSSKIKNGAVTSSKINTSGLTVPNANHANSADNATNASHATSADQLGGTPAAEFQRRLWAVVRSDGTLARGAGVVSSTGAGGNYEVKFNRDITGCAFAATIGHPADGAESFGEIEAHIGSLDNARDTVGVFTANSTGAVQSRAFHLIVAC